MLWMIASAWLMGVGASSLMGQEFVKISGELRPVVRYVPATSVDKPTAPAVPAELVPNLSLLAWHPEEKPVVPGYSLVQELSAPGTKEALENTSPIHGELPVKVEAPKVEHLPTESIEVESTEDELLHSEPVISLFENFYRVRELALPPRKGLGGQEDCILLDRSPETSSALEQHFLQLHH